MSLPSLRIQRIRRPRSRLALLAAAITGLAWACDDGAGPTGVERPVRAASVVVGPQGLTLLPGDTSRLAAEPRDDTGRPLAGRAVTWASSDTARLVVAPDGLATARAPGEVIVTATVDGRQGTARVVVRPHPVARIELAVDSLDLRTGERRTIAFTLRDAASRPLDGRVVAWRSSDSTVVTVDTAGRIETGRPGVAQVVATVEGASDTVRVRVTAVPVFSVRVSFSSDTLVAGDSVQGAVQLLDSAGRALAGRGVSWRSGDTLVARVDSLGRVRALAAGAVSIVATSEGRVGTAPLVVVSVPVASVSVAPDPVSVLVGDSAALVATMRDAGGSTIQGRPIAWRVVDSTVARVSPNGVVVGVAAGVTSVVARAEGKSGEGRIAVQSPAPAPDSVRVVTFGDSNTDFGYGGTDPTVLATSYVTSRLPRATATAPNAPTQLAGKIETRWRATSAVPIRVVNHGIGGATSGGAPTDLEQRTGTGAPHARTIVDGVTRFEGEVLGLAYPWSGGEPVNASFPDGPIRRVNAFRPDASDFAYVSIGTNDPTNAIPPEGTAANVRWMIDRWVAAGLPASHFILTTLTPSRHAEFAPAIVVANDSLRVIAARTGVTLIDLGAHVSADGGLTWRDPSLHVGDALHYAEAVRDWLAAEVVDRMRRLLPAPAP